MLYHFKLVSQTNFQLNISNSETEDENEQPSDSQVILGHFGNIVGNMFNIMQNPENAQNVGTSITGIFANIVGLAVHAIQDKLGPNATEEEIQEFIEKNLDSELKEQIRGMIITRTHQMRRKIENS